MPEAKEVRVKRFLPQMLQGRKEAALVFTVTKEIEEDAVNQLDFSEV